MVLEAIFEQGRGGRSTTRSRRARSARVSAASTCCGATRPARSAASRASSARRCAGPPARTTLLGGSSAVGSDSVSNVSEATRAAARLFWRHCGHSPKSCGQRGAAPTPASSRREGLAAHICAGPWSGLRRAGRRRRCAQRRRSRSRPRSARTAAAAPPGAAPASCGVFLGRRQSCLGAAGGCACKFGERCAARGAAPAAHSGCLLGTHARACAAAVCTARRRPSEAARPRAQVRPGHDQVHLLRLLPGGVPGGRHRGGPQL